MNRPATADPVMTAAAQRHVRPVARVSTEYYLRAFDSLTRLQQDIADGGIFLALVHGQLIAPHRKAIGVRELSRKIGMPYETVRRHAQVLVRRGKCTSAGGGLAVPAAVLKSRAITAFMRALYIDTVRLLQPRQGIEGAQIILGRDPCDGTHMALRRRGHHRIYGSGPVHDQAFTPAFLSSARKDITMW